MGRPVVLAVGDDPATVRPVEDELRKRYGADYDLRVAGSAEEALATLTGLREDGGEVALVLADQRLRGTTGIELLGRVRVLHPGAQRSLLIDWGDRASAPVLRASALRRIDDWIARPWPPGDDHFHQAIALSLYRRSDSHRPGLLTRRVLGEGGTTASHR